MFEEPVIIKPKTFGLEVELRGIRFSTIQPVKKEAEIFLKNTSIASYEKYPAIAVKKGVFVVTHDVNTLEFASDPFTTQSQLDQFLQYTAKVYETAYSILLNQGCLISKNYRSAFCAQTTLGKLFQYIEDVYYPYGDDAKIDIYINSYSVCNFAMRTNKKGDYETFWDDNHPWRPMRDNLEELDNMTEDLHNELKIQSESIKENFSNLQWYTLPIHLQVTVGGIFLENFLQYLLETAERLCQEKYQPPCQHLKFREIVKSISNLNYAQSNDLSRYVIYIIRVITEMNDYFNGNASGSKSLFPMMPRISPSCYSKFLEAAGENLATWVKSYHFAGSQAPLTLPINQDLTTVIETFEVLNPTTVRDWINVWNKHKTNGFHLDSASIVADLEIKKKYTYRPYNKYMEEALLKFTGGLEQSKATNFFNQYRQRDLFSPPNFDTNINEQGVCTWSWGEQENDDLLFESRFYYCGASEEFIPRSFEEIRRKLPVLFDILRVEPDRDHETEETYSASFKYVSVTGNAQ